MSDEFRDMSKNDLVREVKRLRAMLSQQMEAAPGIGEAVDVVGIVGMRDGAPLVQMRAGEAAWQMSPLDARRHALLVLNAASEAERDAATVEFMREYAGKDATEDEAQMFAASFLNALRDHRQQAIPGDPFAPATTPERCPDGQHDWGEGEMSVTCGACGIEMDCSAPTSTPVPD